MNDDILGDLNIPVKEQKSATKHYLIFTDENPVWKALDSVAKQKGSTGQVVGEAILKKVLCD